MTKPGMRTLLPFRLSPRVERLRRREFGGYLNQVTGGNKDVPLVFYCLNVYCWMSYNAALRAINLGYTRVLWYRGGIEAWQQADLPTYNREF
jgi:PQQ-dependent catabolism-associated CXXCW motif protein